MDVASEVIASTRVEPHGGPPWAFSLPFDPEKPMVTSGIRVGTPALTTRGMSAGEMRQIGALINRVLDAVQGTPAVHLCFGNYGGQSIQKGFN